MYRAAVEEDRGMVSRGHTLRLSDHDGGVIADKNDHLRAHPGEEEGNGEEDHLKLLQSYDINAYNHKRHTPLMYTPCILLSCMRT